MLCESHVSFSQSGYFWEKAKQVETLAAAYKIDQFQRLLECCLVYGQIFSLHIVTYLWALYIQTTVSFDFKLEHKAKNNRYLSNITFLESSSQKGQNKILWFSTLI